jgi:hypothetical protein
MLNVEPGSRCPYALQQVKGLIYISRKRRTIHASLLTGQTMQEDVEYVLIKVRTGSDTGTPRQKSRSKVLTNRVHFFMSVFTNTRWSKSQLTYNVLVGTGMLRIDLPGY